MQAVMMKDTVTRIVKQLLLLLLIFAKLKTSSATTIDVHKAKVWGPGLKADFFVPVRYFFIQAVSTDGENITESLGEKTFEVKIFHTHVNRVRAYITVLDRKDGMYIVRFRLYQTHENLKVSIMYNGQHVAKSPYELTGLVEHEKCNCPEPDIDRWFQKMGCPNSYSQIQRDLSIFHNVDLEENAKATTARFSNRGSHSLCHYKIIDNKIYRKTYGQHVGFKMFSDAILLSLSRKVHLPDIEFFVNLGDWPLEKRHQSENPLPIFSWCGSDDTLDIVMPTYDITEATLEMLSRQSLDIFSVMGNSPASWENKSSVAFWRGRDSRQERLDLVMLSRKHPDIIDAKMTRMFFFPHDEEKYGELVKYISFFDFFKYKYQLNIDGTVAAYRFPYLMAGDAVVFKQDSHYYEHFYKDLEPYKHYVPFKHDLSDLLEQIQWAKDNEAKVRQISKNAQNYALDKLVPAHIFCYHVKLFNEYSQRLKSPPSQPDDTWELVEQPKSECECKKEQPKGKKTKVENKNMDAEDMKLQKDKKDEL